MSQAFAHADYREQSQVEPEQLQVWKNDRAAGRFLLWYSHTTHILAGQEIHVQDCDLIVCR